MLDVGPEAFEVMVSDALDSLPPEFTALLRNIVVQVDDGDDPNLFGFYEGVPLTERTSDYAGVMPDVITIYRRAIVAACDSEADVVAEVRTTVVHEVGHHFGIEDDRLHELGY